MRQQVEVDEAVVERRDQRVGKRMRHLRQARVRARTVDQDEIGPRLERGHCGGEPVVIGILARLEGVGVDFGKVHVGRSGQVERLRGKKPGPVVGVAPHRSLPQVEVQRADPMAHSREGGRDVHGHGGFARTALFIADDDDVCHCDFLVPEPTRLSVERPVPPYLVRCAVKSGAEPGPRICSHPAAPRGSPRCKSRRRRCGVASCCPEHSTVVTAYGPRQRRRTILRPQADSVTSRPTLRHIVFFSARNKADIPRIVEGLSLLGRIPHSSHFEVRRNTQSDALSSEVDVVVYAEFNSAEAMAAYKADPITSNPSTSSARCAICGSRPISETPACGRNEGRDERFAGDLRPGAAEGR